MQYSGFTLFYRLLQTDLNGQQKFTDIKMVRIETHKNVLTLQFNPVRNEAVLKYVSSTAGKAQVRIIDQLGRTVLLKQVSVENGSNQISLATGGLAKGIYEVELVSTADRQHVRMMKE